MEQIINYVQPELLVLAPVLYFIGMGLKDTERVSDKYIPVILGIVGCVLAAIYVVSTCSLSDMNDVARAIFTAIVQGILAAGLSTYVNQIFKQMKKVE